MKKNFLCFICCLSFLNVFAQEIVKDSIVADSVVKEKKLKIKLDMLSRYIWRGQSWGGDYVVFQPTVEYQLSKKIMVGAWATSNFKNEYFYQDGSSYKGYQEFNVYASYNVNEYLSIQLWDYYWPSVEKVEGINNNYFNYKNDGVKTLDFIASFDFSEVWLPFTTSISTLIAGNDYRYDANGNNPKQNFTTYTEIGYTFEDVANNMTCNTFKNIQVSPSVGIVFNNQAKYYAAGDYDKPSLVTLSLKMSKEFALNESIAIPVSFTYIHNAAQKNTETFGRNYMVFNTGLTFW